MDVVSGGKEMMMVLVMVTLGVVITKGESGEGRVNSRRVYNMSAVSRDVDWREVVNWV